MKIYIFLLLCTISLASITQADDVETIYIEPSSSKFFSLFSNPTTGFSWFISDFGCELFQLSEVGFVPYDCGLAGSGGVQLFQASAAQLSSEGDTAEVELHYERSWEDSPAKVKKITLYATHNATLLA
jgi:predicted secreted protein